MELTFKFTEEEIQKILQSLANEPYIQVFELVNKIQTEGNKQLNEKPVNKNPFFAEQQEGEGNGV